MWFSFLFAILPIQTIQCGDSFLQVEIADTYTSRKNGLMGREHLEEGSGMLFIFPRTQPMAFWMKETLIPLSIGFFDEKRRLFQIIDMSVPDPLDPVPTYKSRRPARYALEVPQGWFTKQGIEVGMEFSFRDPSP